MIGILTHALRGLDLADPCTVINRIESNSIFSTDCFLNIKREKLASYYSSVRQMTESLCGPLELDDYCAQPTAETSPPKWHLGHTSWFFDVFAIRKYIEREYLFNQNYDYIFNSYYETVGSHLPKPHRGSLSRPTLKEILNYRHETDETVLEL